MRESGGDNDPGSESPRNLPSWGELTRRIQEKGFQGYFKVSLNGSRWRGETLIVYPHVTVTFAKDGSGGDDHYGSRRLMVTFYCGGDQNSPLTFVDDVDTKAATLFLELLENGVSGY